MQNFESYLSVLKTFTTTKKQNKKQQQLLHTCKFDRFSPQNTMSLYQVRYSSMIRAFAYDMMGHQIDPSWWTH